ncbi:hypothetical protein LBW59_10770 [Ralstonia solanacearum]|uniref:Uncharacterized protein n=1 Tax=Ralstonia solanacearum TaxID=305 RepID=A0AAW5ZMX3_RALSL|nr:hypothetical protein [Ralstonia solanacearum]MDB0571251.1 hypothetical protein [Ralstonia solanacearum]
MPSTSQSDKNINITMPRSIRSVRLPLLCALLLAACASPNGKLTANYHPDSQARIRVYWGAIVHFHFNTQCAPEEGLLGHAGNSMLASKPGLSSLTNKTVGMPLPPDAARYYHEYLVPAGQPLTISTRISRRTLRGAQVYQETSPRTADTFTPQPGQDYEVFVDGEIGLPRIHVRQLHQLADAISTEPVAVSIAPACEHQR